MERKSVRTSIENVLVALQAAFVNNIASTSISGWILWFKIVSNSSRCRLKREHTKNTCSTISGFSGQDGDSGESSRLKRWRYARKQPCPDSICVR
ncbi:hypothetical protein EVAR_38202_1 [Eumeta japonica]|uniref:Uncharacterized protein n=1 Tax=Eumeta variegata TaxID=151549 RepID=A0A4C1WH12_EUMVA|nr:hypothetical protein EVAR_38202_1 [Eumeta japonica]